MGKYLVLIDRKSSFTGNFLQGHREFLQGLRENQTLLTAGGFADQTGGAYVLQADSLEEARNIAKNDPMNQENESVYTIKEWNAN
ncbi:YciI family protein [Neobacillus sp. FSL H8-0543]|uniref:YciI family protein n=1 Tax=Neobacillus sp. FSL H8-0543 TaxID=2954672 RepID=UPI0031587256